MLVVIWIYKNTSIYKKRHPFSTERNQQFFLNHFYLLSFISNIVEISFIFDVAFTYSIYLRRLIVIIERVICAQPGVAL